MNKVRQRLSGDQWMGHVSTWSESGHTQSAYCRLHGLALGTFNNWVGRVKRSAIEAPMPLTVVPVVVQPDVNHVQLNSPLSLQHQSGWQLQLPAGIEANWLGKVLKELS